MRVLIVDDEPLARSLLGELLRAEAGVEVVGEAGDGFEAVRRTEQLRPDLVLLDIQMPKLSGFEVLELLGEEAPAVIFVTAHDEFALRAFEVHAVDYLLKPVEPERLAAALDFIEAQDDYLCFSSGGRRLRKQQTMSDLEAQLDGERFVRIHRSYLLNVERLARLEQYARDSWVAILADGTRLPVSRSGHSRLRELLG